MKSKLNAYLLIAEGTVTTKNAKNIERMLSKMLADPEFRAKVEERMAENKKKADSRTE